MTDHLDLRGTVQLRTATTVETAKLMSEWMRQQVLINTELQRQVQGLEARVLELESWRSR